MNNSASARFRWHENKRGGSGRTMLPGRGVFGHLARLLPARERRFESGHPGPGTANPDIAAQNGTTSLLRLFNEFPTPIILSDQQARISAVNPAAAELLGGRDAHIGLPLAMLLPSFGDQPCRNVAGTRRESVVLDGGVRLDLEVRSLPVGGNGRTSLIHVLHDVTPYMELSRMREQLLHNVAHELNGPICTLENTLELAREEPPDSPALAMLLGRAGRTAGRLRSLMGDLLTAGTIQSGELHVTPRAVAVTALLDEAIEDLRPALDERRQRVSVQIEDGVTTAFADRNHVLRVLTNLLSNASKYGPPASVVGVHVARDGAGIRFDVTDDGPGIAPEEQARMFSRYYRARPRGQTPGIGLGLAIARGVIEAHGGAIGIESSEGAGARVWFTLPDAPAQPPG